MTTYTAIPNTDIDVDSPLTTSLFVALRDNPIALAEGDASAPRIEPKAISNITARAIFTAVDTFNTFTTGFEDQFIPDDELFDTDTAYDGAGTFTAPADGTVKIDISLFSVASTTAPNTEWGIRVKKNGSAVQDYPLSGTGSAALSSDVFNATLQHIETVSATDTITVFIYSGSGQTASGSIFKGSGLTFNYIGD